MKPCAENRKSLALLAAAVLHEAEAAAIREHLCRCPACLDYFVEMSVLCDAHRDAAGRLPEAILRPAFLRRVSLAIRGKPSGWRGIIAMAAGRRLARVATSMLLVTFGAWALATRLFPANQGGPSAIRATITKPDATISGPAWITYRLALNRSPEALDLLLNREAARGFAEPVVMLRPGLMLSDSDP